MHLWLLLAQCGTNCPCDTLYIWSLLTTYICQHGVANPADTLGADAGPIHDVSPTRPSASLHAQTSPFAAWSAQEDWDSYHGCSSHQGLAVPSRCVGQARPNGAQGSPVSSGASHRSHLQRVLHARARLSVSCVTSRELYLGVLLVAGRLLRAVVMPCWDLSLHVECYVCGIGTMK